MTEAYGHAEYRLRTRSTSGFGGSGKSILSPRIRKWISSRRERMGRCTARSGTGAAPYAWENAPFGYPYHGLDDLAVCDSSRTPSGGMEDQRRSTGFAVHRDGSRRTFQVGGSASGIITVALSTIPTAMTYALCGFVYVTSPDIFIGGIAALVPRWAKDVSLLRLRAL